MWFKISSDVIDFIASVTYTNTIDALELTVKQIMSNYTPPYRLMVTGGVDSQTMLLAWKWFGKNYIPTSVRYNTYLNSHDLETLNVFSARENMEVQYLDFDLLDFYNNEYFKLAEIYKITSPHFGAHLGMTENLNGTIIFSGDRLSSTRAMIGYNNICLYNASLQRSIVPYFLLQTPEIAYSKIYEFSKNPSSECYNTTDEYSKKIISLHYMGIPVIPQTTKYTGFEKVKDLYDQYSYKISNKTRLKYSNKSSKRPYDLLLRYPLEEKFGCSHFKYNINKIS
jgi:hypothetical protein